MKVISNEEGNIVLLTSFIILGLFLMAIGLVEIGKFLIVREQVQTIADASTLAGAGAKDSAQKWVTIDVHTQHGSFQECGGDPVSCWCVGCGSNVVRNVVGPESYLLDSGGWQDYSLFSCGNCDTPYDTWYTFSDRQLIYNMSDMTSQINALNNSAKEVRSNVTNIVDDVLGKLQTPNHRRYTSVYQSVMRNKTLEEKQELADNEYDFTRRYVTEIRGFSSYGSLCSSEYMSYINSCYTDPLGGRICDEGKYRRYLNCKGTVETGQNAFSNLQSIRHIIDNALGSVTTLEGQVKNYENEFQNEVNSPDYETGKERAEKATFAFFEKATETKGLKYGVTGNVKDMNTSRVAIEDVKLFTDEHNRYHPSVVTILRVETPAMFQELVSKWPNLPLFSNHKKGIRQTICSQSSTMYYDKRGHKDYSSFKGKLYDSLNIGEVVFDERWTKYIKVPDDYCKEWREGKHKDL